ncbi:Imm7 family immunity protein [Streptomyces sp. G6]|uniref:Imm7 family immunity protein n=1 Tax=Streptomyces sp. G6 TaxID=1178736 RepID=UPI003EDA267A
MFEYHGWTTVRETAAGDDDGPRLRQVVDELRLHVARTDSPYLLDLRWMNGEPFIHLGGCSHHRSSPDVVELSEHVAAVAPGSYGLLHIRDDEEQGHENDVRVLRLVRGMVTQHTEALLSPCVPTVEEATRHDGRTAYDYPAGSACGLNRFSGDAGWARFERSPVIRWPGPSRRLVRFPACRSAGNGAAARMRSAVALAMEGRPRQILWCEVTKP